MKTLTTTLCLLFFIITSSPIILAQNIDANRMNRDIKIMENILGELFKTYDQNRPTVNATFSFSDINSSSNVRGTYLPGYGVIFNIITSSRTWVVRSNSSTNSSVQTFYYSSDESNSDKDPKVTEDAIKLRIQEFLKDYATTIGQLAPTEHVMVIYGSNSKNMFSRLSFPGSRGAETEPEHKLPVISASITKQNLDEFRAGKINASTFEKRIQVATSTDKEHLDLKVMGNIFETALSEHEEESFRLSGSSSYLLLDNFGAIFNLDVNYRSGSRIFGAGSFPNIVVYGASAPQPNNVDRDKLDKEAKEQLQKIEAAYSKLKTNLKEYLIDYGRTIKSIESDQFILLTVNVRGRYENIPERVDLQVKKSVFEQLDKGSISREQALKRVVLTEY